MQGARPLRLPCSAWLVAALALMPTWTAAQVLTPLSGGAGNEPAKPWREVNFPKGKIPPTQFDIHTMAGERVLRLRADRSYGVLSHAIKAEAVASTLSWRWQLEQGLPQADLRSKAGDDSPLKVCVMFDMALDGLSLGERNKLRFARLFSGEPLPAATLCYVWDHNLNVGAELPNPYTPRMRYLVLGSGEAKPGVWQTHTRDVAADFKRAFGHESATVPPMLAVVVGADADNTQGSSVGYVADIALRP